MLKFSTIREIWSSVESTDTKILLQLDDSKLVEQLEQQVVSKSALTSDDINTLRNYISSKLPLIRDLAYSKVAMA